MVSVNLHRLPLGVLYLKFENYSLFTHSTVDRRTGLEYVIKASVPSIGAEPVKTKDTLFYLKATTLAMFTDLLFHVYL